MPKATINENSDAFRPEDEVRATDNADMTTPPADSKRAQNADEPKLSRDIAPAADARHDCRALCRLKNINHVEFAFAGTRAFR